MRNIDMLNLNNTTVAFASVGLFTTDSDWIHPRALLQTYEIIYVTEGEVFIQEGDQTYHLLPQDLLILRPGVVHQGVQHSQGRTAFYWVHFYITRSDASAPDSTVPTLCRRGFRNAAILKELMHHAHTPNCPLHVKDAILLHLLSLISLSTDDSPGSALASRIWEWTRINASAALSVHKVTEHFGYNPEYISRLIRKHYGVSLKSLTDSFILEAAKNLLCNTTLTVKEIAFRLQFPSANHFVKFYRYHEDITPSQYRNQYVHIHMNNR